MRGLLQFSLLLFSVSLFAFGQHEQLEPTAGDVITVAGTLSVKGSEPFTFPALTLNNGTVYKLQGELSSELRKQQGKGIIEVIGILTETTSGPGRMAVIEVTKYNVVTD